MNKFCIYDSIRETEVTEKTKFKFLSKKCQWGQETKHYYFTAIFKQYFSWLKCKPLVFTETLGYKGIKKFMDFSLLKLQTGCFLQIIF